MSAFNIQGVCLILKALEQVQALGLVTGTYSLVISTKLKTSVGRRVVLSA